MNVLLDMCYLPRFQLFFSQFVACLLIFLAVSLKHVFIFMTFDINFLIGHILGTIPKKTWPNPRSQKNFLFSSPNSFIFVGFIFKSMIYLS